MKLETRNWRLEAGNRNRKRNIFLGFLLAFLLILNSPVSILHSVYAQLGSVANNLEVADKDAKPGDIVSQTDQGIARSTKPFDTKIFGVVVEFPVVSTGDKTATTVAVASTGKALVNVTAGRGKIGVGDEITSSDKPGVGQRADVAGYVLGKALEPYTDTSKDGQIQVLINIGNFSSSPNVSGALGALLGSLTAGFQNTQNFPLVLRYTLSAIIALVTFIISATTFVRFMRNGLEAIGRNPLAKRTIISGMVLNAIIVAVLTIGGFGIAAAIVAF